MPEIATAKVTKPKVNAEEYARRREKVLQYLKDSANKDNAKLLLFSGREKTYSNDVHYPFRVNSDFYYLTGLTEPDAALVLDPNSLHPYTLYVRPKDPNKEIWDGYREGLEGAKANFGADQSFDIKDVPCQNIFKMFPVGFTFQFSPEEHKDPTKKANNKKYKLYKEEIAKNGFADILDFVHAMRSVKSESELECMRYSNKIAHQAHRMIKEIITPGIYEYELEAAINNVFRSQGASGWSYPPIVASGANSCILHYINNNQKIEENSVVLVDAGCEYEHYASDITRVYAASGKFSSEQQELYDLVLDSQIKAIDSIKPGSSLMETHEVACSVLAEGLQELGYIQDKNDPKQVQKYYMHSTGHSIGIDVHDLGVDKKTSKYVPGMVVTVEPGLYIPEKQIGIRIEDDVVITKDGFENLTEELEK